VRVPTVVKSAACWRRLVKSVIAAATMLLGAPAVAAENEVVIRELHLEIEGWAAEGPLRLFLDVAPGDRFDSLEALAEALDRERQDLLNRRSFSRVEYRVEVASSGAPVQPVAVVFELEERLALLPLPYVSFDSNTGTELGADIQYRNAFGTMTDWRSNPYVRLHSDGALGEWAVGLEVSNFKVGRFVLRLEITQEHDEERGEDDVGAPLFDYAYDRTRLALGVAVQLWGQTFYSLSPHFVLRFGYTDALGSGGFVEDPLEVGVRQRLSHADLNWRGNQRFGHEVALTHSVGLAQRTGEGEVVVQTLGASAQANVILGSRVEYYARLHGVQLFNGGNPSRGESLRGIPDSSVTGNTAVFLNQTVGLQIVRWLEVLDVHLHPFVDLGLAHNSVTRAPLELRLGVGADLLLFLDFIGGFVVRTTVGFDAGRGRWDEPELILAVGHLY
jgi:hypothetical protein